MQNSAEVKQLEEVCSQQDHSILLIKFSADVVRKTISSLHIHTSMKPSKNFGKGSQVQPIYAISLGNFLIRFPPSTSDV